MGNSGFEVASSVREGQGEVVRLQLAGLERLIRGRQGQLGRLDEHGFEQLAAGRGIGWRSAGECVAGDLGGPGVDVAAVAGEPEHPVRDDIDECLQTLLALTIEADEQSDRNRCGSEIPDREEDGLDALRQLGEPADQVDDQSRQEDHAGHEDRSQLSTRASEVR